EIAERVAVPGPVPGDREITKLPRVRRRRIMSGPVLQIRILDALDDDLLPVVTEPWDAHDGVTVADRDRGRVHLLLSDRSSSLHLLAQVVLRGGGLDAGAPQGVRDEQQNQCAGGQ